MRPLLMSLLLATACAAAPIAQVDRVNHVQDAHPVIHRNDPTTDTLGVEGSAEGVAANRKDRKKSEKQPATGEQATPPAAQQQPSQTLPESALGL